MRMSVEVVGPVIKRSADEVFDFFTNFENSPLYGRTITCSLVDWPNEDSYVRDALSKGSGTNADNG